MTPREAGLTLAQLFIAIISWPFLLLITIYQYVKSLVSPVSKKSLPHGGKKPKVVLITGAAGGLGRAFALHYAEPGTKLAIVDVNEEGLEETKVLIEEKVAKVTKRRSRRSSTSSQKLGASVTVGVISVTDQAAMKKFITEYDDENPIDMVMANAGISGESPGLANDFVKSTRVTFDINVNGVFNTVCPLIPRMKERKKGQIAITSSMAGLGPVTRMPVYAASKMAVRGWGESLRHLLRPHNVFVNIIAPAFVDTPMTQATGAKLPFLVPQDVATKMIVDGLAKNVSIIALPWQMFHIRYLMDGFAPLPLRDWFENMFTPDDVIAS